MVVADYSLSIGDVAGMKRAEKRSRNLVRCSLREGPHAPVRGLRPSGFQSSNQEQFLPHIPVKGFLASLVGRWLLGARSRDVDGLQGFRERPVPDYEYRFRRCYTTRFARRGLSSLAQRKSSRQCNVIGLSRRKTTARQRYNITTGSGEAPAAKKRILPARQSVSFFHCTFTMASANLRQVVLTCSGHTRPVVDLCFAQNQSGKCLLISACKDGKPMLRDGVTGDWIGTFEGHKGAVWSVHMDQNATLAATGSADFSAKIWDLSTGDEKLSLPHKHIVRAVELSPDGSQLTTGSSDKVIRRFDLSAGEEQEAFAFTGHQGAVKYVRLLGDGKRLLSVGDDRSIKVWDLSSGECLHTQQLPDLPQSLEISANGERFVITMDKKVSFWSTNNYQMTNEFTLPCKMYAASLHADEEFFVCGGDDFKMYKMNFETGEELESFKGHFGPVHCCAFSSDGELYASGSEDGTVRLWQTIVGKTYGLWKYVDANGSEASKTEA